MTDDAHPTGRPARGSRRWLFAAAALFMVLGLAVLVAGAVNVGSAINAGVDVRLPGPTVVSLPEPGDYGVALRTDTAQEPDGVLPEGAEIVITSPAGARLGFVEATAEPAIALPGTGHEPLGAFTTPSAGEHTFEVTAPEGTDVEPFVVNVRRGRIGPVAWAMVGVCFGAATGGAGLIVLLILGVVRLLGK